MNCDSIKLIYFSPTNTTRKIAEGIARGIQAARTEHLDLTRPEAATREFDEFKSELAIIGVPVYGGRVPLEAVSRLKRLKASQTPAVIIVLYGNRAFDDALLELKDLVVELGFIPLAGGAFIGEHSYSIEAAPIAGGRPDAADLEKAVEFGRTINKKLRDIESPDIIPELNVPGNIPLKERGAPRNESPATQADVCTLCETCASVCPVAAITMNGEVVTDRRRCIMCQACVKNCPTGARFTKLDRIDMVIRYLTENCSRRKEPETFL